MPIIELSKGMVTEVSEEDFAWACRWKWCVTRSAYNWYAMRRLSQYPRPKILLHRAIAARMRNELILPPGLVVHHEDRDSLNNRRDNIVVCTQTENLAARVFAGRPEEVDDPPF